MNDANVAYILRPFDSMSRNDNGRKSSLLLLFFGVFESAEFFFSVFASNFLPTIECDNCLKHSFFMLHFVNYLAVRSFVAAVYSSISVAEALLAACSPFSVNYE